MSPSYALIASLLLSVVSTQSLSNKPEIHPKLTTWKCTKAWGCREQHNALVLDSASHPIHQAANVNATCGDWGSAPNATVCPDEATCAKNCVMDGISNYTDYGVTTQGANLQMTMFGKNGLASPRIYLLAEGEKKYEVLKLTGQELSFDVDVSKLPCGMNGAFYLSEMKENGGQNKLNPGGAAYGTGYCDAQCFVTPWVDGVGNIKGEGICCNELDIWEANARATHLAPHPCSKPGVYRCTGDECDKAGVCDKDGCGMNPYRQKAYDYYGPGLKIDTTKPFTVVTQFLAPNGVLTEIVRKYIQNGKVFENAAVNVTGPINDAYCANNGAEMFGNLGGMKTMGESMSRGMVLALSIWWDEGGFMQWLDSDTAGPCSATEGDPKVIQTIESNPTVKFSQIKWGDIGTTFSTKAAPALGHHWKRDD